MRPATAWVPPPRHWDRPPATPPEISDQAQDVDPDEASRTAEEAQRAAQHAAPEAEQAADTASAGTLWTFAGLLIGAIVASIAGLFGSRSVSGDRTEDRELHTTRA